jgi:hypothetical protein
MRPVPVEVGRSIRSVMVHKEQSRLLLVMYKTADGVNRTLVATCRTYRGLHGLDAFAEGALVVNLFHRRTQCLSRQIVWVEREAKPQIGAALRSPLLLHHLRYHDHRYTKVQTLHHAVHAAVGHKHARPLEHLKLWNVWSETELRDEFHCHDMGNSADYGSQRI